VLLGIFPLLIFNKLLFLILMLAIKAFHVLAIFIEKITFELMSHFFYKNNSEMSWVQQQIAPLLSLNINRLMISLYSRNLDPFFYHYIVLVIYSNLRCWKISKNILFCVIQNVSFVTASLILVLYPFRHKYQKDRIIAFVPCM